MPRGRPVTPLTLSESEESELGSLARSRTLPHSLVLRAQIVLACAEGVPGSTVARRLGVTNTTVGKWRKRYREHGIPGLHDELRPGRPRTHEDERVAEVINTALQTEPPDRSLERAFHGGTPVQRARSSGGSICSASSRIASGISISNDPFFVEKVRDIVGLYLIPQRSMRRPRFKLFSELSPFSPWALRRRRHP